MSAVEILDEALRDEAYISTSGGGVTFSGGEPLMHGEFLREALSLCKENGLHTALDTAGNVAWTAFEAVLPYTDLFLYDIKLISEDLHREWTGAGNSLILENLSKLCGLDRRIWLRIPVIPGVNCADEMRKIAEFTDSLPSVERVELLPYHPYGAAKYRLLGLGYDMDGAQKPSEGFMLDQAALFQREVKVKNA